MSPEHAAALDRYIATMHDRRTRRLRVQAWAKLTRTPVPWWRAFGFVADPGDGTPPTT